MKADFKRFVSVNWHHNDPEWGGRRGVGVSISGEVCLII